MIFEQGLVIVGTESGAIFAYGDGFQYMQPAIDTVDITHLVSLNDDSILVGFADNCLAVLMLPSLNLSHKLPASWLNDVCGDITTLYVDEKHFRPYAYVGTSEGYVRVLQVLPDFREVEYCVTCADTGMTGDMAVSALEISPKDERYLMIAYDSNDEKSGAVVIYDMVKHKTYKVYKSVGITTAVFSHTGEALYAGIIILDHCCQLIESEIHAQAPGLVKCCHLALKSLAASLSGAAEQSLSMRTNALKVIFLSSERCNGCCPSINRARKRAVCSCCWVG